MQRARVWTICHAAIIAGFMATVATYYHPGVGLTAFLTLPASSHDNYELPSVRTAPHWDEPGGGGYDGQFYAQIAVDPLLTDPAIDKALDSPPYRARRILLSWTAYAIGLGRPAWILQVFALQNVIVWLVFAWLLLRWFPIGTARAFALWCACLLTHGMLSSVRYALVDAPSALLVAAAVVAVGRERPWVASICMGLAGLARETSLIGTTLFTRFIGRSPKSWCRVAMWIFLSALPLIIWMDYLRSIYRDAALATGGNVSVPFVGLWWKTNVTMHALMSGGRNVSQISSLFAIIAFVTQVVYVVWIAVSRRVQDTAWLPIALPYAVLGLMAHRVVWDGSPGAITRVALPLAIAFNVLARKAPWPVLVLGNLTVISGVLSFLFRV